MTVTAYRIFNSAIANPFDGEGARVNPGRWNSRGVAMVYTSSSRALAMLEILAHLTSDDLLRTHYRIVEAIVPANCVYRPKSRLPKDWQLFPAPASTRKMGDRWVLKNKSVAMAVPSALVPKEYNYLINPRHPDFQRLVIKRPERIEFDTRLVTTR